MKESMFDKKELITICQNKKNIYIYGAGRNAGLVYHFLKNQEIYVKGFIVTEMSGNPENLFDRVVTTVDKLPQSVDYVILVPVSEGGEVFKEICSYLVDNRVHNVYFFTKELLESVRNTMMSYKARDVLDAGIYHFSEKAPVELGHSLFTMEKDGREYHWRFKN